MTHPSPDELRELIVPLARQELLPRFTRTAAQFKADGSLVTEADLALQQRIVTALTARWPQIPILGEEMPAHEQQRLLQQSQAGLWCLDPLDGTTNFAAGIPYFGVALALIRNGVVELGLIYDAMRDELFSAQRGQGASLNGAALACHGAAAPEQLGHSVALIDLKRLSTELSLRLLTESPFTSQRNFGSSALDWCMIAVGRGHLYLHGRQNLWDYAAGSLILAEAGGQALTLDGEPVFRASLEPRSVVAARDPALFAAWCGWLGVAV